MKLKMAAEDLKYLLNRGYRKSTALKFVANHYLLNKSQRNYLSRLVFSDEDVKRRMSHRVPLSSIKGSRLFIDGFNVLISTESVLSGSNFFIAQDGFLRDSQGSFGRYRIKDETRLALDHIIDVLVASEPSETIFFFDRNVSHSGKLKVMVESMLSKKNLNGKVILSKCVDCKLKEANGVVATSDSAVIDNVEAVVDIPMAIKEKIGSEQDYL